MSKEVKLFFIMPGAVPVLQSDSPAYTPMTNCETGVHTVPVVLGEDYDALIAERNRLRDALKSCLTQLDAEYMPSDESATAIRLARAALQGEQP